jgi:nicotinamidase-related amidase
MRRPRLVLLVLMGLLGAGVAVVAEPAMDDPSAAGCTTALLVVDVQNAYVPSLGLFTADGADLIGRLVTVLAEARAARIPVVYIKQSEGRFADGNPLGDIVAAIAPHDGDTVIWKAQGNAFAHTELDGVLSRMGAHRVLITGLATHACVNATVFGALDLGYETWVLADAHSGSGGPGVAAYYNSSWPAIGVHVVSCTDIEWSFFACVTPVAP